MSNNFFQDLEKLLNSNPANKKPEVKLKAKPDPKSTEYAYYSLKLHKIFSSLEELKKAEEAISQKDKPKEVIQSIADSDLNTLKAGIKNLFEAQSLYRKNLNELTNEYNEDLKSLKEALEDDTKILRDGVSRVESLTNKIIEAFKAEYPEYKVEYDDKYLNIQLKPIYMNSSAVGYSFRLS